MKEEKIIKAHEHSSLHRDEILKSEFAGCFYCAKIFLSSDINTWIDEDKNGIGQTAICPKCGIDSVIGDKSGFTINAKFLAKMRSYWF